MVSGEGAALSKSLAAARYVTDEGSLARVSALVCHAVTALSKRFAAALDVANVGSLACVSALV